ncbi:hypothetical protein ACLB1G_09330 [Oxalobacteraceae bacterium A2-2]
MHHDSHILSAETGYCVTCGQKLPDANPGYGAWERTPTSRRIGIGISIALHLIGVLYYFLKPSEHIQIKPPRKEGAITYIAPLPIKPTPEKPQKKEVAKQQPKAAKPPPPRQAPKSITPPAAERPKLETFVPPVQATMKPPPEEDMSEMIAKRRAAREAANPAPPAPPAPESDNDRALRIARANIAGAQAKAGTSGEKDDSGGIFSVDKSYHSAELKFRGWNTNFKRRWLQQVHVEQGAEQDIETAVVKKMIELIRQEKPGDFEWDSHRLGKVVRMSARKEDEKELQAFLMKEMFPEYRR